MRDDILKILDQSVNEAYNIYDTPNCTYPVQEVVSFLQQHFEYGYRQLLMSKNPETAQGEQLDNLFKRRGGETDSNYRERISGLFKTKR